MFLTIYIMQYDFLLVDYMYLLFFLNKRERLKKNL